MLTFPRHIESRGRFLSIAWRKLCAKLNNRCNAVLVNATDDSTCFPEIPSNQRTWLVIGMAEIISADWFVLVSGPAVLEAETGCTEEAVVWTISSYSMRKCSIGIVMKKSRLNMQHMVKQTNDDRHGQNIQWARSFHRNIYFMTEQN